MKRLFLTIALSFLSLNAKADFNLLSAQNVELTSLTQSLKVDLKNLGPNVDSYDPNITDPNFALKINRCSNVAPGKSCYLYLSLSRDVSRKMDDELISTSFNVGSKQVTISFNYISQKTDADFEIQRFSEVSNTDLNEDGIQDIGSIFNASQQRVSYVYLYVKNKGNKSAIPKITLSNVNVVINRCQNVSLAGGKKCLIMVSNQGKGSLIERNGQVGTVTISKQDNSNQSSIQIYYNNTVNEPDCNETQIAEKNALEARKTWQGSSYSCNKINQCKDSFLLTGFHIGENGSSCEPNQISCQSNELPLNAITGVRNWNHSLSSYESCLATSCLNELDNSGFHVNNGLCQPNTLTCGAEESTNFSELSKKYWNHSTQSYGSCDLIQCQGEFNINGIGFHKNEQLCEPNKIDCSSIELTAMNAITGGKKMEWFYLWVM